jgi:hypothetical protein
MDLDLCRRIACDTAKNFEVGFAAGTVIIAGGKAWNWIKDNKNSTAHETFGYIGKPEFRRQLAVFFSVCMLSIKLFDILKAKKFDDLKRNIFKEEIYDLSAKTVSLILAIGSAKILTKGDHLAYEVFSIAAVVYSACEIYTGKFFLNK